MIRHFAPSAGVVRCVAARLALAVTALSALFLVGLLVPGTTEGVGDFNVNGRVTKIRADYTEPCDPGNFVSAAGIGSTIGTGQTPSPANPLVITIDGDVKGCLATDAAPGRLLIEDDPGDPPETDEELFFYSVIAARTGDAITSTTYTGAVALEDLPDQHANDWPDEFPASGQAFIGLELVNYTRSSSTFTITSRNKNALASTYLTHPAGSLVRVQGKLKLVKRNQRIYIAGPQPGPFEHSSSDGIPADVRSPKIQLTCRGRLEQTSQTGNDSVLSRTRCYAVLEPGSPWGDGPIDTAKFPGTGTYPGPLLPLTPIFFHELSTGTINETQKGGTQNLVLTTDFLGIQCFPYIEGWLWTKITNAITLDTNFTVGDDDDGKFQITLYTNSGCTTQLPVSVIPPLGQNDSLPGKGAGTNLRSTQLNPGSIPISAKPTPGDATDTDGDGCSDYWELGSDLVKGGLRDPLNPWDYFNPLNNNVNRVPDISAVVLKYGTDQGNPAYDVKYDRGGTLGNVAWSFKPPNGTIRVPDITAAVSSYGHDCTLYSP